MNIPYFDTHCDTASEIIGRYGLRSNPLHLDLERGRRFSRRAQVFALYADGGNFKDYIAQRDNLFAEIKKNSDIVSLCRNANEAETAFGGGKTAAFISVEGAEMLDCSVKHLEEAHADGLRIVTLTWNHANELSGSNADRSDMGLTDRGREFVRSCNRLDVFVDVSHLSDRGFWDVVEISDKPVIATHSNSRSVWNHVRNLTDEMFDAIIKTGGIVGINLYGNFLSDTPDIPSVLRHIEHFLKMGGEKHLAIGADFDGCDILPKEIHGIEDMPLLFDEIKNNFGEKTAENIFFNNVFALFNSF